MNVNDVVSNSFKGKRILSCLKRTDLLKEIDKMMTLLRRTYNVVEMEHLNPGTNEENVFPRNLMNDIFNYLQVKDQTFRTIVIKRQKRYRNHQKKLAKKNCNIAES